MEVEVAMDNEIEEKEELATQDNKAKAEDVSLVHVVDG